MITSSKQREFIRESNHRYNLKIGARRCGKSYLDNLWTIPNRILERKDKNGLNVILGVSKGTIERNVLQPMREIYGKSMVGFISSQNIAKLFGEDVYCLGAEKANQVSKIQGTSIKYCYGDEVAKWNQDVFVMVQGSLDKPYSVFDGALNPESEMHWLKTDFIDKVEEKELDVYVQHYTIFDNPFLSKTFVDNLCKEYEGTVFYDRLILGKWCNAEGLIYKKFANNPDKYKIEYKAEFVNGRWEDNLPDGETIVGIDYGGTKSGQAFVCTRISYDYKKVIVLASRRITDEVDSKQLLEMQIDFIEYCEKKYHCKVNCAYPDNEESVHIRSLKNAYAEIGKDIIVRGCVKEAINDRIDCEQKMLSYDIFQYVDGECDTLVKAMRTAMWDSKKMEDTRLDDFSTDIDSLDAFEYSFERRIRRIIDAIDLEIAK